MARPRAGRRAPAIMAWTGGVVAAVVLVGAAVVAQGYDAQDVPTVESSVWVPRDAAGGQFARVNTDIGEIESVNDATGVAGVVQTGQNAVVFGSGFARYWSVAASAPVDVADAEGPAGFAGDGVESPAGVSGAIAAGGYVLFAGPRPAYAIGSDLSDPAGDDEAVLLTPPLPDGAPEYLAAASTISADGRIAVYSVQESERVIRTYDIVRAVWDVVEIAAAPTSPAGLQLAFVGDRPVLLRASGDGPQLWVDGAGPFSLPGDVGAGGLLQASGPASEAVLVASDAGLFRISLADGAVLEVVPGAGRAAQPVAFDGEWAAAWLASGSGRLWVSGASEPIDLAIDGGEFDDNVDVSPVLVSNGDRAVLLERSTGMLWTVPDGQLIPLQQWTADELDPTSSDTDVPDESPAPPVSVDDAFGVRAGALSVLPVLYNDHDPNIDDVLTIDPTSVSGLDPAFGTLSLVGANQTLVVEATGAVPSASFTYRATDGKNASPDPATVTLSLRTDQSPPVWCEEYVAPAECRVPWPEPQLLIGGTATFDVLKGWVDPEGDAFVIDAAVPEAGAPLVAMPGDDGRLAIAHTDRAGAPGTYTIAVTVRDAHGAVSAPRDLVVSVLASPDFTVRGSAVAGPAGEWATTAATEFASGGSGAYRVLDVAEVTAGGGLEVDWHEAEGTIRLRAAEPGDYLVTARIKDAATPNQHDVSIRYSALPSELTTIAVPPLTAYVRQGEDTLVDILGAVQNTTDRVLLVASARPGPVPGGGAAAVSATVIDSSIVQLRSIDSVLADGRGPAGGALGVVAVDLVDADGGHYRGAISVFLVPASGQPPIAVPDTATVRAGDVAEIDVLANDVAPRGERLALHPDVSLAVADSGLAFSAGRTLRYVAPEVPGTYTAFYFAYLEGSPSRLSRSQVTITVLPSGANRAPQAIDLESRTFAGRTVTIPVPVDAMDPDGDRVVVASVTQPLEERFGAVMVGEGGRSLQYFAPEANQQAAGGLRAGGWQAEFTYTVRDTAGETATATVRVAVSAEDPDSLAPVTFGDHVRVQQVEPGGDPVPIRVEPLRNDRDPAAGSLAVGDRSETGLHILYEVRPNMQGMRDGAAVAGSPYAAAQQLLVPPAATTRADGTTEYYPDGTVHFEVTEDTAPGTYHFLYTAESLQTRSTAEGVISITVSAGETPNQPVIEDTVVTVPTRAQLTGGGIDVLTGKVVWPTGDASGLRIAELGAGTPAGLSFDGRRIRGSAPETGAIVPFRVEYGTDQATGEPQSSWGLLRIPAFDDYRLQVVQLPDPVTELETGEIELLDILGVAPGDGVEIGPDSAFATHRPSTNPALAETRCAAKPGAGAVIEYTAGYSPGIGSDTCTLDVRLTGQSDAAWSTIIVPIPIKPKDPLAILTPVTKTVNVINGRVTVNLHDEMVAWTGGFSMDDAGLRQSMTFTVSYAGGSFTVTPSGPAHDLELAIDVLPTAPSGGRETVSVHLDYPWPSDPSLPHFQKDVVLVLYVGSIPAQGPTGATLAHACDAKTPEQCQLPVVFPTDQSGQFNPLTGNTSGESTALRLAGVAGGTFTCPGLGQATAQGDVVRLALDPAAEGKPPGGTCDVPFTVTDVRGRTGAGLVSFDVTGFPQAPDAPVTAAYGEGFVEIDVVIGGGVSAHPPVTAMKLFQDGTDLGTSPCARLDTATFRCTVTGLANGEHHVFTARSVNTQGDESALSAGLETWAFVAPSFVSPPVYDDTVHDAATTPSQGRISVAPMCLDGNSANAGEVSGIELALSTGAVLPAIPVLAGDPACTAPMTFTVDATGPVNITATPISGTRPPRIGTVDGGYRGSGDVQTKVSRGAPSPSPTLTASWDGTGQVTVALAAQWNSGNAAPVLAGYPDIRFYAVPAGDPAPSCSAVIDGTGHTALDDGGWAGVVKPGTTGATFAVAETGADLAVNHQYRFLACGTYGYGVAQTTVGAAQTLWLVQQPAAPGNVAPGGSMTYTPAATPATMDAYASVSGIADGPTFSWAVPDTPPTSNFQMADADALPTAPGTGWQLRFATSSALGDFTATPHVSTDGVSYTFPTNTQTWFARYCFTDGQTFCSDPSAPIGVQPGSGVGIDFGATATVSLPTHAVCTAAIGGLNDQIAAAGEAAIEDPVTGARAVFAAGYYEPGWHDGRGHPDQPGYTETHAGLVGPSTYYDGWSQGYTPGVSDREDPAVPGPLRDAFLTGYGTLPGFDDVYLAPPDDTPANLQAARDAGRAAGAAYANDQAVAAGNAAVAVASAAFIEGTDAPTARGDAEAARLDQLRTTGVAAAPSLAVAVTGFATAPFVSGPSVTLQDDGSRFTAVRYDFTAGNASTPSDPDMLYVLDFIRAELPAGGIHDCG